MDVDHNGLAKAKRRDPVAEKAKTGQQPLKGRYPRRRGRMAEEQEARRHLLRDPAAKERQQVRLKKPA